MVGVYIVLAHQWRQSTMQRRGSAVDVYAVSSSALFFIFSLFSVQMHVCATDFFRCHTARRNEEKKKKKRAVHSACMCMLGNLVPLAQRNMDRCIIRKNERDDDDDDVYRLQ